MVVVCVCVPFSATTCALFYSFMRGAAHLSSTQTPNEAMRGGNQINRCVCKSRHLDNDIVADDLSAKHDECVLLLSSICGKASFGVCVSVCGALDSNRLAK